MPLLAILAIGIPGSGKTTLLKPLAEKHSFTYINRDDIREELLGDARNQSQNKEVWEEANRRAESSLSQGRPVLLDATFAEPWKRVEMIRFLRSHGATRVVGITFTTPLAEAKRRNIGRERVVPEAVLEDMHVRLSEEPPAPAEGFDAIYIDTEIPQLELREFSPANSDGNT